MKSRSRLFYTKFKVYEIGARWRVDGFRKINLFKECGYFFITGKLLITYI